MIFEPTQTELNDYYGPHLSPEIISTLAACHQNIQKNIKSVIHLTTSLNQILNSGKLLMSAGGLAGCLYGIPLYKDDGHHNLADYILNHELPMFLKNQGRKAQISAIVATPSKPRIGCVDYLSFGSHYFEAYTTSSHLRDKIIPAQHSPIAATETKVANKLHQVLCSSKSLESKAKAVQRATQESYILRMLYFEVALECVFLLQNDTEVTNAQKRYELYNKHAKDLVFSLNPMLATRFSLKDFHSSPKDINQYLTAESAKDNIILGYQAGQFYSYLAQRMEFYIRRYLLDSPHNLTGHVLFRYFDERPYFEEYTARKLWNEAQDKGYSLVTYRLPKGEVGLLPNSKTDFFSYKIDGNKFTQDNKLSLQMSARLTTKSTTMRNPYAAK